MVGDASVDGAPTIADAHVGNAAESGSPAEETKVDTIDSQVQSKKTAEAPPEVKPVSRRNGWAPIKAEFVRPREEVLASKEANKPPEANGSPAGNTDSDVKNEKKGGYTPSESPMSKSQKKKNKRGRNKKRPKDDRPAQADVLCPHLSNGNVCNFGDRCRFSHDVKAYLEKKGPDIGEKCPIWDVRGSCPSGLKCRFGRAHTDPETLKPVIRPGAVPVSTTDYVNGIDRDLQAKLRRNQVPFACDRKGWNAFLASLEIEPAKPKGTSVPSAAGNYNGAEASLAKSQSDEQNTGGPRKTGREVSGDGATPAAGRDAEMDTGVPRPTTHASSSADTSPVADVATASANIPVDVGEKSGERENARSDDTVGDNGGMPPPAKRARLEMDADAKDSSIASVARDRDGVVEGAAVAAAGVAGAFEGERAGDGKDNEALTDNAAIPSSGGGDVVADEGGKGLDEGEGTTNREDGEWVRSCLEGAAPREERKRVDFENKVYVAPLTTVGNLPFRRVMKNQGADITCGEMAICHHLLKGNGSEWALLRRHPSEDVFGVQIAGAHPDQMTRVAELLETSIKTDFVDINMGCPIDLVCDKGMGAALMGRGRKLKGIIAGMTSQLSCPLTVKMRVGWDEKKPNADSVVRTVQREAERCRQRGFPGSVAHVMIHGRSRLQRYSKLADWEYVRQVAASQDSSVPSMPVIGNGDILCWQDHHQRLEQAQELCRDEAQDKRWSTCCMLARGALIKPWLPTEVKEKRDWDISSSERLDIYRNFVNYGLEHWGSDQMGVNKTRRFMLEWLSFTCRYIPVGILEVLPQRINERPLPYNGRDELESLLSSQNPNDWIKICEMLLGPAPSDFEFEPKHKASSYAPLAVTTYV